MQEIDYNIKIVTQEYSSSLINDANYVKTNEHFRMMTPIGLIKEIGHPLDLCDGWEYEQIFNQDERIFSLNNTTRIENSDRIIPTLKGIVTSPSDEIFLNTNDFFNFISNSPVMGVRSSGLGINARAFIFNRKNNKISIEQEFQYIHINAIKDKILNTQFSEIYSEEDDYNYIVFKLIAPNPISMYKKSSLIVTIMDFVYSSSDYNYIPLKYSISEKDFLSMCDYVTLKRKDIEDGTNDTYQWVDGESGATISTDFFPIYNYVTVIAKYIDEGIEYLYQVNQSEYIIVDAMKGVLKINSSFNIGKVGEIDGFYIYYGILPAVYINPPQPSILLENIVRGSYSLTHMSINTDNSIKRLKLDSPTIELHSTANIDRHTCKVEIPREIRRFFIEPSSNILINNKLVLSGKKIWMDNNENNKIQVGTVVHVLDMLDMATSIDGEITPVNKLISQEAVVYGLFQYGELERGVMASIHSPSGGIITEPSDGGDGYSQGTVGTHGTIVYYETNGGIVLPVDGLIRVSIHPIEIGYEIVLPAWAKESSISVVENYNGNSNIFTEWSFIGPDIIILNKNKVYDTAVYDIEFLVSVNPILENVNVQDNIIKISEIENPYEEYDNFKGYFVLSSKEVKVRIGYSEEDETEQFFPEEITVNIFLEQDYLERVVTGTKTILL